MDLSTPAHVIAAVENTHAREHTGIGRLLGEVSAGLGLVVCFSHIM